MFTYRQEEDFEIVKSGKTFKIPISITARLGCSGATVNVFYAENKAAKFGRRLHVHFKTKVHRAVTLTSLNILPPLDKNIGHAQSDFSPNFGCEPSSF
eukprot:TRINITY_DN7857_c0_g1_i1.p1 TRINITY_DN7857_c0_g1~~TRINITY_DN7857_c0_g1_i1.p1  ORF type:complete len:98 (+),score=18.43 TRINITY_DN7857_c0_g1_i1:189-482(+)